MDCIRLVSFIKRIVFAGLGQYTKSGPVACRYSHHFFMPSSDSDWRAIVRMGVRENFSRRGSKVNISLILFRFQMMQAMQMDVHKTLYPFYTTKKMPNVMATIANSVFSTKKSIVLCNVFTPTCKTLDFKHASH